MMRIELQYQPSKSKPLSKRQKTQAAGLSSKNRQTLNRLIKSSVEETVKHLKLSKELSEKEISVVITGDHEIKSLNRTYRKKDYVTNVLSFPFIRYKEGELMEKNSFTNILGEIVLSYEKCAAEAKEQGKKLNDHLVHLIIHSTLHLLGFDHEKKRQAERMEEIEIKILKNKFKIKNPYDM
jgi:probable rRNA maturation factor